MAGEQQWPKLGVSASVWRGGKVLLVQRAKPPKGIWAFPGGHVEAGEKLEEAAASELGKGRGEDPLENATEFEKQVFMSRLTAGARKV